jgi:ribosomal protein L13E
MRWSRFLQWLTADEEIVTEPKSVSGRQVGVADGFSLLELERVGLSEREAEELGLKIDRTRRTGLGSNLVQLEKFLSHRR